MSYIIGNKAFCDLPSVFSPCQNADSYTICKTLNLLDCNNCDLVINDGRLNCNCDESWNCNLCGNDLPYWNTVNFNDQIYFQFQQPDTFNGNDPETPGSFGWGTFAKFEIYRCCDDTIIEGDGFESAAFVGLFEMTNYKGDSTFQNIQQICFDVNTIIDQGFGDFNSGHCFYFKFFFATSNDPENPDYSEICSEPYKLNYCSDKTVLLEGDFGKGKDCFGYFYGGTVWNVGGYFQYINQYRVRGVIEQTSTTIEKETVTRQLKAVNSQKCEDYTFNTYGVPEEIANLIAEILNARTIFGDGKEYQINGSIDKNNEIGSQWFLEVNLRRCDCFKDYSCNDKGKKISGLIP